MEARRKTCVSAVKSVYCGSQSVRKFNALNLDQGTMVTGVPTGAMEYSLVTMS
jgi:hypothetical protein